MSLKITHKNSTTAGTPPSAGDIDVGEIAMNAADAELYTKDVNGNIKKFANTDTTGTAAGVQFTQAGTGAVERTVSSKLQDVVSVTDFGADPTGVTNARASIQDGLDYLRNNGGGTLFIPPGEYLINAPLRVFSNTTVQGSGMGSTLIKSTGAGFPPGNVFHLGYGNEWDEDGAYNSIAPWRYTDASVSELKEGDYTNIKVENIVVRDLTTENTNDGAAFWIMNAKNVVVENIECINSQTPINIGNDAAPKQCASCQVTINNIWQKGFGAWYDLVFVGQAYDCHISNLYSDPNAEGGLSEMVVVNGGEEIHFTDCHFHKTLNDDGSYKGSGVNLLGAAGFPSTNNSVSNCTFKGLSTGVVCFNGSDNVVSDNTFNDCGNSISLLSRRNIITNNTNFTSAKGYISANIDSTNNIIKNNNKIDADSSVPAIFWTSNVISNNSSIDALLLNQQGYQITPDMIFGYDPLELSVSLNGVILLPGALNQSSVDVFFAVPRNIKQIDSFALSGYVNNKSYPVTLAVYGQNSPINQNLPVLHTFPPQTLTGNSDWAKTFSSANDGTFNPISTGSSTSSRHIVKVSIDCSGVSSGQDLRIRVIQITGRVD